MASHEEQEGKRPRRQVYAITPEGETVFQDLLRESLPVRKALAIKLKLTTMPADLWEGQTDEQELGFSYEEVDRLLPKLGRGLVAGRGEHALDDVEARCAGVQRDVRFVRGKGEVRRQFAARPFLFGYLAGSAVSVDRLELWPGDRVRCVFGTHDVRVLR